MPAANRHVKYHLRALCVLAQFFNFQSDCGSRMLHTQEEHFCGINIPKHCSGQSRLCRFLSRRRNLRQRGAFHAVAAKADVTALLALSSKYSSSSFAISLVATKSEKVNCVYRELYNRVASNPCTPCVHLKRSALEESKWRFLCMLWSRDYPES